MVETKKGKQENGFLKLLASRYDEIIRHMPDAYRIPNQDPRRVALAIEEYTKWHESDPFAHNRIALYLKRGYEFASDVYRDYHRRNLVREMNRRKHRKELTNEIAS